MSAAEARQDDPLLDLDSFQLASAPARPTTAADRRRQYLGLPAGILVFLLLYLMPAPEGLTGAGQGALALFSLALVWWVTEPVPNYVTSLLLMVLLICLGVRSESTVLSALGLSVIWLNITAFVLSSVLMRTNLARRLALQLIVRFGRRSSSILLAFLFLHLVLASMIPATAARTVMVLPVMMIVAMIYGASPATPNAFSRNLILQNQMGINLFSSAFLTGSTCNLIAAAFILEMAGRRVYYTEWLLGALPVILALMLFAWWAGPRWVFPLREEETRPRIPGGLERLQDHLRQLGPMSAAEKKGGLIFGLVLFLWITDQFHLAWFGFEVSAVVAALIGTILAFLPRIGILAWKEADIPWHLLIFSTGAYAGGLALTDTGAAQWAVGEIFAFCGIGPGIGFFPIYAVVVAVTAYSHFVFTSKTMRTLILIPIIIAMARELGFDPVALALPAAFTLSWVIGLPISAKPNVILYSTGQFSVMDNFRYGFLVTTAGVLLMLVAGPTWFRLLGIVP